MTTPDETTTVGQSRSSIFRRERATAHRRLGARPNDIELSAAQMQRTPLFRHASPLAARRLETMSGRAGMVIRRYSAGEHIIRQGEAGWTAFYLLSEADIERLGLPPLGGGESLANDGSEESDGHEEHEEHEEHEGHDEHDSEPTQGEKRELAPSRGVVAEVLFAPGAASVKPPAPPLLDSLVNLLYRRKPRRYPAVEAQVVLTTDVQGNKIATMRAGELFGEVSCFNHAPRTATVRAARSCYAIEMVRNVLELALENEDFKARLDETYRARVLRSALTLIPLFEDAPAEAIATLREHAELISLAPGDVVFEEGAAADALYFVRMGTLRIHTETPSPRVLFYASRGESLGVHEVLGDAPYTASCSVYSPPRESRSQRAVEGFGAELIRLPRALVMKVIEAWPDIGARALQLAEEGHARLRERSDKVAIAGLAGALGLVQSEKLMLIDLQTCTRCDDCVRACADSHEGVPRIRREGPRFGSFLVPDTCRQCLDPTCLIGCPVGSIHRGTKAQIVIEDWCIGCGLCAEQCPFDAIELHTQGSRRKAVTCDQCASLGEGPPLCVYACGAGAAQRVDGREYFTPTGKKNS